jgi:hypothetical protein
LGPDDLSQGWRPDQNIDPRIMISPVWAPIFKPLPIEVHRALTASLLAAWMDKNLQYPIAKYLPLGLRREAYTPLRAYGDISGGQVWEAAQQFRDAGVEADLVRRLQQWGSCIHRPCSAYPILTLRARRWVVSCLHPECRSHRFRILALRTSWVGDRCRFSCEIQSLIPSQCLINVFGGSLPKPLQERKIRKRVKISSPGTSGPNPFVPVCLGIQGSCEGELVVSPWRFTCSHVGRP